VSKKGPILPLVLRIIAYSPWILQGSTTELYTVNKIDWVQPFIRGPVRQLSFKENYSPSKRNGRIFCKPSWWKVLFKLPVPNPMCCPILGIFMASNTLGSLFDLSYPCEIQVRPSHHWLIVRWVLYYQISLGDCVKPSHIGDTDWSINSTKVLFTICIVRDYIEHNCSRPISQECNNTLSASLMLVLWLVWLHVSLLRFHVPFCITCCSCFGCKWVWCNSTYLLSIVIDPDFSLNVRLNPLVDVLWTLVRWNH
jgi:hypothetical protein